MRKTFAGALLISIMIFGIFPMLSQAAGESSDTAVEAFLGDNTASITQYNDFWFFFEADISLYYEFSLVGPSDTDFEMVIFDSDMNDIDSAYSGSYPDNAYGGYEDFYYINVMSGYGSGEFTLTITTIDPPDHASKSDARPLLLGNNDGQLPIPGIDYYFIMNTSAGQWYELIFDFTSNNNDYAWAEMNIETYDDYYYPEYFNSYNDNQRLTYFEGQGDPVYIVLYSYENVVDFTLSLALVATPSHWKQDMSKTAHLGTNTGEFDFSAIPFYFNFTTVEGQWYRFDFTADETGQLDYAYYSMDVYTDYYYYDEYTNGQAWGESPLSTIIRGNGETAFIRLQLEQGVPVPFTLDISETAEPEHYDRDTAKEAFLGNNSGETIASSIDFWFVFDAETTQFYAFEIESNDPDMYFSMDLSDRYDNYIDNQYYGNQRIAGGHSQYYIRVHSYDRWGAFNLIISETTEPLEVEELRFSPLLQEGDIFRWEISSSLDVTNPNMTDYYEPDNPFTDGSILELEVTEDAPVWNVNNENYDYYGGEGTPGFELRLNGTNMEEGVLIPLLMVMLPTRVAYTDGTVLDMEDYVNEPSSNFLPFGEGAESTIMDDELIFQLSEDDVADIYLSYNTLLGHLTSLDYQINTEGVSMSLVFTLQSAPEATSQAPEIFGLPLSPVPFIMALIAIPIIRRKFQ